MRRRLLLPDVVAVAFFALPPALAVLDASPALATILLFNEGRNAAGGNVVVPIDQSAVFASDYGDNATGATTAVSGGFFTYGDGGEGYTPNISLDFFTDATGPTSPGIGLWQTDYGDLVNVIFSAGPGIAGSPVLNVLFSAEPGFSVDLYGFDLGGWNRTDYTIAGIEVIAGTTSLFSATNVLVEGNAVGPGHTTISFVQPLSAQELLLRIDVSNLSAGIQDNIGIDNIRFGQTPPPPPIPEPGTALLLGSGLGLLAVRRRLLRGSHEQYAGSASEASR